MEKYGYLWICVFLFIPWFFIYFFNKRLRRRIVLAGLISMPFAFIEDIWFRVDYWNPPEIYSIYPYAIEDLLFAFLKTGIGISLFDALFTKEQVVCYDRRVKLGLSFFPITIASFFLLNNILGLNSMYMWSIPFFVISIVIIILRKDLWFASLVSAFLHLLIIIPIYMILFNIIAPDFWNNYWFLAETKHGITILGNVPVLELLYYFSFASTCAIMYDFVKGTKKIPNKLGKKLFG